jgi:nucleotide-binding universal stress UspA family protein
VATGAPAEEIARIAVSRGAGLIVIGLRRQADRIGARTGSVAHRVLSLAPSLILALPAGSGSLGSFAATPQAAGAIA